MNYKQLLELNSDVELFDEIITTILQNFDENKVVNEDILDEDFQKLKFQKIFNKVKSNN
jgi:hypothetical protein